MNLQLFKKILLPLSFLAIIGEASAVPAKPGLLQTQQPDGSIIKVRMEGDENRLRILSEDGYLLTSDSEGYYVFADRGNNGEIIASDIRDINPEKRTLEVKEKISKLNQSGLTDSFVKAHIENNSEVKTRGMGLGPTRFPYLGEQRSIVILVEFADRDFTIENPKEYYTRFLNEEGFSDYKATGSVKDYFVSNSNEKFIPQFDVYGPVKLDKNSTYFGRNSMSTLDAYLYQMVAGACELLDEEIDFSLYDRNEDGIIDNIYFYYAGYGEADGGGANTIWPQSQDMTKLTSNRYVFDGVLLDHFACSNELQYSNNDLPDGIGTFCHEFSHVMGLPDLYTSGYGFTPKEWDILDIGTYNNDSRTPPNYSSYSRYALEWMEPEILTAGEKTLLPLGDSNKAYILVTENENEYFLFENRQLTGYDAYLPGHGMLIWHIDFDEEDWSDFLVNNMPNHQRVDLVEADDIRSTSTLSGDSFPGSEYITEFSYETSPSFVSWNEEPMPYRIFNISEDADGLITFMVEDYNGSKVDFINTDSDFIKINGNLVQGGKERVEIYKVNGQKVTVLQNNSEQLPSGIYLAISNGKTLKFVIR